MSSLISCLEQRRLRLLRTEEWMKHLYEEHAYYMHMQDVIRLRSDLDEVQEQIELIEKVQRLSVAGTATDRVHRDVPDRAVMTRQKRKCNSTPNLAL